MTRNYSFGSDTSDAWKTLLAHFDHELIVNVPHFGIILVKNREDLLPKDKRCIKACLVIRK